MGKTHFEQIPVDLVKRIVAIESGVGAAPCTICGDEVLFEDSKTDERGRPVHEDCYVTNLPR
jgi:hypothetical protein